MSVDDPLRVACLQLSPGDDLAGNIDAAVRLANDAARQGARFVLLPEYAFLLHGSGRVMRERALAEAGHPALQAMREFAQASRCWTLIGSLSVTTDDERLANRSLLIDDEGRIAARYDKLHMFDAALPGGRTIRESSSYRPGRSAAAADTPWGRVGLSICYDLRFPQLYRALAKGGCRFLTVPSAFMQSTGALHWHALLRARAIENACFVLAPATCGTHPGPHATFGHSLVVGPGGDVLADGGTDSGVVLADIDPAAADRARQAIPSLTHDREFEFTHFPLAPPPGA